MSAELFYRRFALFRNLSPPTVDGDGGMRSRKHSSNNRITLSILSVLKKISTRKVFWLTVNCDLMLCLQFG